MGRRTALPQEDLEPLLTTLVIYAFLLNSLLVKFSSAIKHKAKR